MSDKKSSRRQFLKGRSLLGKIREIAGAALDATEESNRDLPPVDTSDVSVSGWPLLRFARKAMATDFEISFNRGQYPQAVEAAIAALDEVDRFESLLSVFQEDSEVSHINRTAAENAIEPSAEVRDLLRQCDLLSRETNGAIDITASPLWRLWGFAKREGKVPAQEDIDAVRQHVGPSFVQRDETSQSVRFAKPGIEISFGCIGKGAALDSAKHKLQELEIEHALLHGGRSSISALGGRMQESWPQSTQRNFPANVNGTLLVPTRDRSIGWTIGISHPLRPGQRLAEVRLTNESLGTSGSQHQFFIHRGKRYGHIIDPRTGQPAQGMLMTTVIAPTAALADAISTAFFVLDPNQTAEYCRCHPGIAALLVLPNVTSEQVEAEIPTNSLTDNDCRVLHFGFEENQIRFFCRS